MDASKALAVLGRQPLAIRRSSQSFRSLMPVGSWSRPAVGRTVYKSRLWRGHAGYTLACGRYYRDGYTGFGLRSQRHLDWGDPAYLTSYARKINALHRVVGGELVLIGVSYSGFGVATLASHHPELHPNRLIVIDSFLDLAARRMTAVPPSHGTGRRSTPRRRLGARR